MKILDKQQVFLLVQIFTHYLLRQLNPGVVELFNLAAERSLFSAFRSNDFSPHFPQNRPNRTQLPSLVFTTSFSLPKHPAV